MNESQSLTIGLAILGLVMMAIKIVYILLFFGIYNIIKKWKTKQKKKVIKNGVL